MRGSRRRLLAALTLAGLALGTTLSAAPAVHAAKDTKAKTKAPAKTHEVQPGDNLWKLAREHGCSVADLREANGMTPEDALVIGRDIEVGACIAKGKAARAKLGAAVGSGGDQRRYKVASGDTLSRIARKHHTSVEELRALNDLEGSLIRVGQVLLVPGREPRTIRLLTGQSRGRPTHGWLHDPSRLPHSSHYLRRRPERTYASAHLVDHTLNAIDRARDQHPGLHRLAIGDLSDEDGGPLSGHHSHQSGRDIDIGFYYRQRPANYPQEFARATKDNLDADATWALVEALVRTVGKDGGVEKIFLDYEVQGWLYAAARKDGWSKKRLREVFQYPDGRYAKHGMIRHEPKHDDHLHVRFRCVDADESCK